MISRSKLNSIDLLDFRWQSTLRFAFHPTVDQVHGERVQLHRNLQSLPWTDKQRPQDAEPALAEVARSLKNYRFDVNREVSELVGQCLWDAFSNENEVIGRDGRRVDIGSWRGAPDFIAEPLNRQITESNYDYMDFYMGTFGIAQGTDLTAVYEMIFRPLKDKLLNWRYRFPQLHLIELPVDRADGARSLAIQKMQAELRKIHRQAIEDAKDQPTPPIVSPTKMSMEHLPTVGRRGCSTSATDSVLVNPRGLSA